MSDKQPDIQSLSRSLADARYGLLWIAIMWLTSIILICFEMQHAEDRIKALEQKVSK